MTTPDSRIAITLDTIVGFFTPASGVTRPNCIICGREFSEGEWRLVIHQQWSRAVGAPVCEDCCAQGILALCRQRGKRLTVPASEQLSPDQIARYQEDHN